MYVAYVHICKFIHTFVHKCIYAKKHRGQDRREEQFDTPSSSPCSPLRTMKSTLVVS